MTHRLVDYRTGTELSGHPTEELVAASEAAADTGVVYAVRVGDWWHHAQDRSTPGARLVYVLEGGAP